MRDCPTCSNGKLLQVIDPDYVTQLSGMPFRVADAVVGRCSVCEETIVSAKEISGGDVL